MKKIFPSVAILATLFVSSCSSQTTEPEKKTETPQLAGYELVWADEFSYTGLPDAQKWGYDVGGNGWGNQELQYYTNSRKENARVENGKLIIESKIENYEGSSFTSARLITKSRGDWTYGRFEIRAKLPYGKGTWPAIWMLPTVWNLGNKGWPDNGEIDIMEHVGYNPNVIHGSTHCNKYVHTKGTQKTATTNVPDAIAAFHNYILEWTKDDIKVYVDDKLYFTSLNEQKGWEYWPFFKDFHLILNIAVGGTWGGAQGIDGNVFPQKMEVDYVRVYKKL
ncbi:MAG: glycoside hydrolase [Stygiobacter sp. RIFOXYC12_FULL_38_8]|nr:MAG: glycoside hydrolase [Stygiobacter sp. GWC2_38_9]OGU81790.1 MAG: glycoside hydrolase [Stygiobacter sp. RIFOXYA12_FULL_38_9]OGV07827.1 MAG: glycoside hydrolase [Stygiobacter sp. RIFOXYB2_FULL_37_11]OGV11691.1 MAG: glycoside hydrolase [Stygiobacter sp. RIFOXYA2_FULL_38_8]OGV12830.1 MAG: glycoside hydrolase [Stygiobacter sp. RIFOXYC2_FULL_38_25]OGV27087.1 MAG: glycoside hydrolase [Stygiobacter sp. RIFOXYC12_FULL_38_8]OGV81913.1 MAG: glycoside hydrolase [Stygiobacter sp. GWF2_38_21]RJQ607